MKILIVLTIVSLLYFTFKKKDHKPSTKIWGKRGDYQGHLDFLVFHGFMSEEERQAERDFKEDFEKNPHHYTVKSLQEWIDESDIYHDPKDKK